MKFNPVLFLLIVLVIGAIYATAGYPLDKVATYIVIGAAISAFGRIFQTVAACRL